MGKKKPVPKREPVFEVARTNVRSSGMHTAECISALALPKNAKTRRSGFKKMGAPILYWLHHASPELDQHAAESALGRQITS